MEEEEEEEEEEEAWERGRDMWVCFNSLFSSFTPREIFLRYLNVIFFPPSSPCSTPCSVPPLVTLVTFVTSVTSVTLPPTATYRFNDSKNTWRCFAHSPLLTLFVIMSRYIQLLSYYTTIFLKYSLKNSFHSSTYHTSLSFLAYRSLPFLTSLFNGW